VTAAQPKISFKAIAQRLRDVAEELSVADSKEALGAAGIEVVRGEARFVDANVIEVGETRLRPVSTIFALGAEPRRPPIPGLSDVDAFDIESILDSTRKLSHLLVIGGDPSAYVLAQAFARLGSAVTVVPQGPALEAFDGETRAIFLRMLGGEGVRVIDGGSVTAIQPRSQGIGATVSIGAAQESLDISHILVADGAESLIETVNPAAATLRKTASGTYLTGQLGQTSNRRIRLAGFAAEHTDWQQALRHGKAVVEAVIQGSRTTPTSAPSVIATDPALVQVGALSAKPGKTDDVVIHRASLAENAAALASGKGEGLVKVVTDRQGKLLGASLVGQDAIEMGALLAIFIERGLKIDALAELSLPSASIFSTLSRLGENSLADRPVSGLAARRRAIRRALPF
jgi:pyruvate/2-oxoglutarate dehydrogenase complex dihydrolipoamide dehydrogenase (E3) component